MKGEYDYTAFALCLSYKVFMDSFASQMQWGDMLQFILRIVAVLICIIVHELSHGVAAYYLGDPTAKQSHRLSINPIRHIDPFGLIMMIAVGFGWAKPVPVNPGYFKNPKMGMAITAFAGPLSNFILAFISAMAVQAVATIRYLQGGTNWDIIIQFLHVLLVMNIGLGVFNLIPFPPLDGSKILSVILPKKTYFALMQYERYGMFLLIALLWMGFITKPLMATTKAVITFMLEKTEFIQVIIQSIYT